MALAVMEPGRRARPTPIQFSCPSCSSLLSVPVEKAGVAGPCPLCGGWLVSPARSEADGPLQKKPFASRRAPVPPMRPEMPEIHPESRIDWRERRRRSDALVSWFQRAQARLTLTSLLLTAAIIAFLYGHGWNLPWNLPEDSAVIRLFQGLEENSLQNKSPLPSGPRRN